LFLSAIENDTNYSLLSLIIIADKMLLMAGTTRRIARVTAFYGEVGCTRYRAALVKQSGADLYVCSWQDAQGTLIYVDLVDRTRKIFREVVGGHRTLHASGDAHTRVEMMTGTKRSKETLRKISIWRDFEITIPLDSIPSEAPENWPWEEATREIVLRSADFENAAGVNLIFCLATPGATAKLQERWDHHWVLDGGRTIVVGAERIAYPREKLLRPRARARSRR
jgi:hypothetical protein